MKVLTEALTSSAYSTVQFIHVELTRAVVELLRARVDYIRSAVERDAQFRHMAFAERSPDLIFRLQDELRPIAAGLDRKPFILLPEDVRLNTSTEKEQADNGEVRLSAEGFFWKLEVQHRGYSVHSAALPWSIIEEL
jgi:hypothetical protein